MCGIYASVSTKGPIFPTAALKDLLHDRGPDHIGELQLELGTGNEDISLAFVGTVLALRGGHVTAQPLTDPLTKSILCWNGEAWKIGQKVVKGNDGEAVLSMLSSSSSGFSQHDSIHRVLEMLHSISGPFAFVYFDRIHNLLYFGRDCLGRRSLLYNADEVTGALQLSSLADDKVEAWREVEADGIYILALSGKLSHSSLDLIPNDCPKESPFLKYRFLRASNLSEHAPISLVTLNWALPVDKYDLNANSNSVKEIEYHLAEALKLRVLNIRNPQDALTRNDTKVSILFSGGLDCTVLARMIHNILPLDNQIDLLNVAFENPRVVQAAISRLSKKHYQHTTEAVNSSHFTATDGVPRKDSSSEDPVPSYDGKDGVYESCPDRITGRKSLRELRQVCPGRLWRFFEINIPYTEMISHRSKIVALMYPHSTEMDLSIASALYFAARGVGLASTNEEMPVESSRTPARVLISGLGADELFGGYTRHATAFERRGFEGLLSELELDVNRLGKRNLGRDDRVIANWGKEARHPYLDESLVNWALAAPVWTKCGFGMRDQEEKVADVDLEPGKKVLRLLARQLGMPSAAKEKKRAASYLVP